MVTSLILVEKRVALGDENKRVDKVKGSERRNVCLRELHYNAVVYLINAHTQA